MGGIGETRMRISDEKLGEIMAGCAEATEGPWTAFHKSKYDEWHVSVPSPEGGMNLALFFDGCGGPNPRYDSQHIANCDPTTVSSLVTELRELREALRELLATCEQGIDPFAHPHHPSVAKARAALSGAKL
jgi:hypothetical protein